jgi:mannose-6-phosphate isomerase-like protein (cupin superfamily)
MKFFHQQFQNFRMVDDLPKPDLTFKNSQWNFVAYAELPRGSTIAEHYHINNDEFYIILAGKAHMDIDGKTSLIQKGDVILTRAGSRHSIPKVISKLKFIAFEILQKI